MKSEQPVIPDYAPRRLGEAIPQQEVKKKEALRGKNPIFLNRYQRLVDTSGGNICVNVCGRATGKTAGIALHFVRLNQSIPRGTSAFVAPSLKSLYCKTQPAMIKSMEQMCGFVEGIHYFRGQPPKKLSWPRPLAMPRTFDNVVYFYTGHITYFISALSVAAGNGYSLTSIIVDEARLIRDFQKNYVESILPALRGDVYDHPGWRKDTNYLYLSQYVCSDNGVIRSQREWYEHYKKLVTPETNAEIARMVAEVNLVPELTLMPRFMQQLNRLRAEACTLFTCSTAYNEALPESFIHDMELQLPPVLFSVQIMGNDIDDSVDNDRYYYCFSPDIHLYDQNEWAETCRIKGNADKVHKAKDQFGTTIEWESPDLEVTQSHAHDDYYDVDLDPKAPLCLSFDLNANFNTVVVSQRIEHGERMEIRIVNCLYTKYEFKLRALLGKFLAYYAHRRSQNNKVRLLFDATLKQGQSYALEDIQSSRYTEVIRDALETNGWDVCVESLGTPMSHDVKFQFINDVLAGRKVYDVRINKSLDFLVAAIGKARVVETRRGPAKDKSHEKAKGEQQEALEERTDVTDALDVAIWAAVKSAGNFAPSGTNGVFFSLPRIM